MIIGYAQNEFFEKALKIINKMYLSYVMLNFVTFSSFIPTCATMGALEEH